MFIIYLPENALVSVCLPPFLVVLSSVPPQENGQERDKGGRCPRHPDHGGSHLHSHVGCVFERPHNGKVPVNSDAAEVEGGHSGEVDIQGVPQITDAVAKVPPAGDFHSGIEGHGKAGHQ